MGSPSARLDTDERNRPWLESGLEFLLQPGWSSVDQTAGQRSKQAETTNQNLSTPDRIPPPRREDPRNATPAPPQPVTSPNRPGGMFPEPWAGFLKSVPPQPKIVWTYMELGLDLGGQPDATRRATLHNIIRFLAWPKGSTAFWPVAALNNSGLQVDTVMFWQGWELWQTPYIVCFGQEALTALKPDVVPNSTPIFLERTAIHALPSLEELSRLLPHDLHLALEPIVKLVV